MDGAVRDYLDIREDYRYDSDPFSTEPDRVARVKWILDNRLTDAERVVLLLYTDCHSYREVGQRLGLSHTLVGKEVRRIVAKVRAEYDRLKNNNNL